MLSSRNISLAECKSSVWDSMTDRDVAKDICENALSRSAAVNCVQSIVEYKEAIYSYERDSRTSDPKFIAFVPRMTVRQVKNICKREKYDTFAVNLECVLKEIAEQALVTGAIEIPLSTAVDQASAKCILETR